MRRTLVVTMLVLGVLTVALTGCGGATSAITGPSLMETPSEAAP
jgi:hypothetical protein